VVTAEAANDDVRSNVCCRGCMMIALSRILDNLTSSHATPIDALLRRRCLEMAPRESENLSHLVYCISTHRAATWHPLTSTLSPPSPPS
jgi:hypothetical protein